MAADNSGKQTHVMIDNFIIDASLNERHVFDSEVTEYPVESGSNIVDNIRPLPLTVEMECLVTNTPIGVVKTVRDTFSFFGSFLDTKPVDTAYALLTNIRDRREPVTIQTSLRTYDNMALERLSIPRGPGGAEALMFTAEFKQISYVTNKRTIRMVPIGKGKSTVSAPGKPDATRLILIDKKNQAWFDPDIAQWREHAFYFKESTSKSGFVTPEGWRLYRSKIRPDLLDSPATVGSLDGKQRKWSDFHKQIIAVPFSDCFHDFVIKRAPGDPPPTNIYSSFSANLGINNGTAI